MLRNTGKITRLIALALVAGAGCASPGPDTGPFEPDLVVLSAPPRPCPDFTVRICRKRTGQPESCRCRSEDDLEILLQRH